MGKTTIKQEGWKLISTISVYDTWYDGNLWSYNEIMVVPQLSGNPANGLIFSPKSVRQTSTNKRWYFSLYQSSSYYTNGFIELGTTQFKAHLDSRVGWTVALDVYVK